MFLAKALTFEAQAASRTKSQPIKPAFFVVSLLETKRSKIPGAQALGSLSTRCSIGFPPRYVSLLLILQPIHPFLFYLSFIVLSCPSLAIDEKRSGSFRVFFSVSKLLYQGFSIYGVSIEISRVWANARTELERGQGFPLLRSRLLRAWRWRQRGLRTPTGTPRSTRPRSSSPAAATAASPGGPAYAAPLGSSAGRAAGG